MKQQKKIKLRKRMSESTFRSPLWDLFSYFLDVFHSTVFVPIRHRNLWESVGVWLPWQPQQMLHVNTMGSIVYCRLLQYPVQYVFRHWPHPHEALTTPTFLSSSPGSFILFFFFFFLSSISSGGAGTAPRPSPPGRRINSIGSISLQHKRRDTVIP